MATVYAFPVINRAAQPLSFGDHDYDSLLHWIGDRRFVLIGEASHGTHDFYRERALITRRLIEEKGFSAVCIEGDWPDAYRVNRYVQGRGEDRNALDALSGFARFPQWMWRNMDVLDFVDWLRQRNDSIKDLSRPAGFYGLDLYSLYASIREVLKFLDRVDPEGARRARQRYACLDHFNEDTQAYGYATWLGVSESCENDVVQQLVELQQRAAELSSTDGRVDRDEIFFAEQNARLVANAERYYRTMFAGHVESWNIRDRHMTETLGKLAEHLGPASKFVVWAHNSHLGDARATEMSRRGEVNVGQLVRERWRDQAYSIGFTTYSGTVTAADEWDAPAQRKNVRPALAESMEALFHRTQIPNFLLSLHEEGVDEQLSVQRLERAIGVIYLPQSERASHYFYASASRQFDAVIHMDYTLALVPIERTPRWESGEPPETYPFAV
jgi:erythromycin esterase-like protein